MIVAYQGVSGAYSHIAARNIFPGAEYIACETFEQAFEAVQTQKSDYAVIPVENSNAGRVADVHFLLPESGLFIIGEYFLRVEHQLLGLKESTLKDIKTVSSHPQALSQCSAFLKSNGFQPIARIDTAKSCQDIIASQDKTKAAIASKLAGELYGLKVLAANIENSSDNTTRFLIMAKSPHIPEDDGELFITSCIFSVKSIPAALYKALGGFATNGINIDKLESYLLNGQFVCARFYIEFESHPARRAFQNAMAELRFFAEEVHILGTYKALRNRHESNENV